MAYQFVQVSARRAGVLHGDFAVCSNLSLMDNQKMTPKQALRQLQVMADEYQLNGYTIEWTIEDMVGDEAEMWGPLFEQAAAQAAA
jgi:hypothetical protein